MPSYLPRYYYLLGHTQGTRLLVRLNDIPFYRCAPERDSSTRTEVADHLLVPGVNTFTLELYEQPSTGGALFSLAWEHDHDDPEIRCSFPELLGETYRSTVPYPFIHREEVTLEHPVRRPAWLDAQVPEEEIGPDGTPELHATVRRIHSAYASMDVGRILAESGLKIAEHQATYPDVPKFTAASAGEDLARLFSHRPRVAPHDPEALHFRSCAGGRVVHVTRKDGGHPLHADASETLRLRADLWLTRLAGEWRLFR